LTILSESPRKIGVFAGCAQRFGMTHVRAAYKYYGALGAICCIHTASFGIVPSPAQLASVRGWIASVFS
jgi:hypothetical protein